MHPRVFLKAVALHRRMTREYGKAYLDRLEKHMSAAGLVEAGDFVPSAPSAVTLSDGALGQQSSTSGVVWNAVSVQYMVQQQQRVVSDSYDPWNDVA